ncbi:hypothetical protein KQI84_07730 [bacterium]|nr:hypothetical protein [bacterium]
MTCRATNWIVLLIALMGLAVSHASAQTCARVKIQIKQELTFERVAFDARLTLANNLTDKALTNVNAAISIIDNNGDPADALFFVGDAELKDVTAVDGTGRIEIGDTGEASWLIVPTVGAGGSDPAGQRYYVTVDLSLGPEGTAPVDLIVLPDSIVVHPQPLLKLEYFFPRLVIGDDPLTENIEERSEPFTFGLRVTNDGHGPANSMKLKTGQPEIIENEKGLLVSFLILGTQVNGEARTPSMLASIGDLQAAQAAMVRWTMTSSLLGEFINFNATYKHADQFGGEKTSLIDGISTRTLVHNVRVDEPGSDDILDFLADEDQDPDFIPDNIYASDGTDIPVTHVAAGVSNVVDSGNPDTTLTFTAPGAVWAYVRIPDPANGNLGFVSAERSDGKILPVENAWVDQLRIDPKRAAALRVDTAPFFHLVDYGSTGQYTLHYRQKPVLDDPGDKAVVVGNSLDFTLVGTVSTGLTEEYSMEFTDGIPAGPAPTFNTATGAFSWSPDMSQIGVYEVTFRLNDGGDPPLEDFRIIQISVDNPNLIVDAGPDMVAIPGQVVTIDATGTQGPSPLDISWNQTVGPPVVLLSPQTKEPRFTAPEVTENTLMTWELTVTDNQARSSSDTMNVIIAVSMPSAHAGPDQTVDGTQTVYLDGSASIGDGLSYSWTQTSGPPVTLIGGDTATPEFTAPSSLVVETVRFRLTVEDSLGLTDADEIVITVRSVPPPTPVPWEGMMVR